MKNCCGEAGLTALVKLKLPLPSNVLPDDTTVQLDTGVSRLVVESTE